MQSTRKTTIIGKRGKTASHAKKEQCEHGLSLFSHANEKLCALEFLNRFVVPQRMEKIQRRGLQLYLVFDSEESIECCCEDCGESHGDDTGITNDIVELTQGRRAPRFRVEPDGHLVIWFVCGDHLHLHRNALERFRPRRTGRSLRPLHTEK